VSFGDGGGIEVPFKGGILKDAPPQGPDKEVGLPDRRNVKDGRPPLFPADGTGGGPPPQGIDGTKTKGLGLLRKKNTDFKREIRFIHRFHLFLFNIKESHYSPEKILANLSL
jgi:hypothetical protein